MVKVAVVVLSLLLATACSPGEGERYGDIDALVAAVQESGIACSEPDDLPEAKLVRSGVSCRSDGTVLSLRIFEDRDDRDAWKAFGRITGESLVIGPDWIVATPDVERAEEIRGALGGDLEMPA